MHLLSIFRRTKSSNQIDSGTKITGNIHSENSWVVAGTLKGDLIAIGDVTIQSTADIVGDITGENVTVAGKVKGNIFAKKNLKLCRSCSIQGDLTYQTIEIEDGAQMAGLILSDSHPGEKRRDKHLEGAYSGLAATATASNSSTASTAAATANNNTANSELTAGAEQASSSAAAAATRSTATDNAAATNELIAGAAQAASTAAAASANEFAGQARKKEQYTSNTPADEPVHPIKNKRVMIQ